MAKCTLLLGLALLAAILHSPSISVQGSPIDAIDAKYRGWKLGPGSDASCFDVCAMQSESLGGVCNAIGTSQIHGTQLTASMYNILGLHDMLYTMPIHQVDSVPGFVPAGAVVSGAGTATLQVRFQSPMADCNEPVSYAICCCSANLNECVPPIGEQHVVQWP